MSARSGDSSDDEFSNSHRNFSDVLKPDNFNDEKHKNEFTNDFSFNRVFNLKRDRIMSHQLPPPGELSACKIKSH